MSETSTWAITDTEDGQRLDRHVAGRMGKSRNQVHRWITDHLVQVNKRPAKPSTVLRVGDTVDCTPPERRVEKDLAPESGDLEILFEDEHIAVINKAAGIAVHPGAGRSTGTLAHFLLDRFPETAGVGGAGRPGIVHRLDLDTTGALIVARSQEAYTHLASAFAERQVIKTYMAVVYGTPRQLEGRIDLPIGRHRHHRKQMQIRGDGRPAVTHYRCLDSAMGTSRLELGLETGRTHQIRIHLKALGHPLVGDPVYGEARWRNLPREVRRPLRDFPRPALHAWRLAFAHPITSHQLDIEAAVPEDMQQLWHDVTGRPWPGDPQK